MYCLDIYDFRKMRCLVKLPFTAKHYTLIWLLLLQVEMAEYVWIIIIFVAVPIYVKNCFIRDEAN